MKGKSCTKCKKGIYVEYSVMSDLFGEYKCNKCGHLVKLKPKTFKTK